MKLLRYLLFLALLTSTALGSIGIYGAANRRVEGGGGGVTPAVAHLGNATSSADTTTYNYNSQPLGTASAGRRVAVAVVARSSASTTLAVSSCTINGVTASRAVNVNVSAGSNSNCAEIWVAVVPTGTTGTITVVMSATALRCGIAIYELTSNSSTPTATNTASLAANSGGSFSFDVNTGATSVLIGAATWPSTSATATWSGLTEDADLQVSGETLRLTAASAASSGAETPRAISILPSAGVPERAAVVAVFD